MGSKKDEVEVGFDVPINLPGAPQLLVWSFLKAGHWNSCTFQLHGQQAKTASEMPIGNVYVISAIAIVGGGLFGYASTMKEMLMLEE